MENRNVLTMGKQKWEYIVASAALVLFAVFMRLIPHIPNVTPLGALALFSGISIPGFGFLLPLFALLISDVFLGFHATMPYVYGSFLIIGGMGYFLRKKVSPLFIAGASVLSSLIFFIVTNFGVWFTSSLYEKSLNGLTKCYVMGLPFFRNTLIGDLFYSFIFFLGYRIIKSVVVLMLPSRLKRERHVGNTV